MKVSERTSQSRYILMLRKSIIVRIVQGDELILYGCVVYVIKVNYNTGRPLSVQVFK